MPVFATQEWLDEQKKLINESKEYEEAAKEWEGDFLYVVQPDELQPQPLYYHMDLYHGKCRDARVLKDPSEVKAEFEISAPYSVWKKLINKELDPNLAFMTGKIKLKGSIIKIQKNTKAGQALTKATESLVTEFPK